MKPLPHDPRLARISAKFMRDCGSGIAVGGGTVALTFMISGLMVRQEVYVALTFLQAVLLLSSVCFEVRALRLLGRPVAPWYVAQAVIVAVLFLVLGVGAAAGTNGPWPAVAYTWHWWSLIVLSFSAAIIGVTCRRSAERMLDDMDDDRLNVMMTVPPTRRYEQRLRGRH